MSIAYLRDIFFFKNTSDAILHEVAQQFLIEWVDEGSVVFEKGAYGDTFYLIVRGSVEIRNPDSKPGFALIASLDDGDYFGEIALLKNVPRTFQAVASSHCIFLTLHASQFHTILTKDPKIREIFEQVLSRREQQFPLVDSIE